VQNSTDDNYKHHHRTQFLYFIIKRTSTGTQCSYFIITRNSQIQFWVNYNTQAPSHSGTVLFFFLQKEGAFHQQTGLKSKDEAS
jgi:hypothetical protein